MFENEFPDFEWDEDKRQSNLEKHGIDFTDAARALLGPHLAIASKRKSEDRVRALAEYKGRIIAVIYTLRSGRCRIISARPAHENERKAYHQSFG